MLRPAVAVESRRSSAQARLRLMLGCSSGGAAEPAWVLATDPHRGGVGGVTGGEDVFAEGTSCPALVHCN